MDLFRADHIRTPVPFGSWALTRAATLDQCNSRGLVADLAGSGPLKRQAAFAVISTIDPADPVTFISRLADPRPSNLGEALRTRQARDLVAAAFNTDRVPTGYLRALTRIGFKPLDELHLYRRLFGIFTDPAEHRKAHALRYCGPITTTTVQVVDVLDPILITPEVVGRMRSVGQANKANTILRFLRSVCSTLDDEDLAAGIQQSMGQGGIERFAQRMIQKADRVPTPPLPLQREFTPITSGPEMIRLGREMRNCLASRIPHALLGLASFYRTEVRIGGRDHTVVVELTPLSNGTWAVEGLFLRGNTKPPAPVMRSLVRRLMELGAVVAMNPAIHRQAGELASSLGVWGYGEFQLLALEDEEGDAPDDGLDTAILDVVLEDVEREFGFA
jgi:hypothetical protein